MPDQNSLKMFIFVTDRLGSTRAVVDLGEREVCEENDYYAFGSRIPGGEQLIENRWRFSGKEEQEPLSGLPYIDFGARFYNPRLGRWLSPDPLAEKYYSLSPFNYCGNDPVNRIDLDGRKIYDSNGEVITYDSNNGWSSNADPKFVEVASLMQKYHVGSMIINEMLTSQIKYTVTITDTSSSMDSNIMGENKVTYYKDDKGDASSIISCDITISSTAIEGRKEYTELSDLEYTAGILAHEWGHGTVTNVNLHENKEEREADADIPMNNFFKELLMMSLPKLTWKPEEIAHAL